MCRQTDLPAWGVSPFFDVKKKSQQYAVERKTTAQLQMNLIIFDGVTSLLNIYEKQN